MLLFARAGAAVAFLCLLNFAQHSSFIHSASVALKGTFTEVKTEPVIAIYESKPLPGDIRNKLESMGVSRPIPEPCAVNPQNHPSHERVCTIRNVLHIGLVTNASVQLGMFDTVVRGAFGSRCSQFCDALNFCAPARCIKKKDS